MPSRTAAADSTKAVKAALAKGALVAAVKRFRAQDGVDAALDRVSGALVHYLNTNYGAQAFDTLVLETPHTPDPESQRGLAEIQLHKDAGGQRKVHLAQGLHELHGIDATEHDWDATRHFLRPLKADIPIFIAALKGVSAESDIVKDLESIDAAAKKTGIYTSIDTYLRDTPAKAPGLG